MAAQPDSNAGYPMADGSDSELLGRLIHGLESFDGVPVISFGWVALFILIYIVVVGPLDYFFLKKVVKRLELTWVTFPPASSTFFSDASRSSTHIPK